MEGKNLRTHQLWSDVLLIVQISYYNKQPATVTQKYLLHFCLREKIPSLLRGVHNRAVCGVHNLIPAICMLGST